jgi:PAS domain S-box-containing protein
MAVLDQERVARIKRELKWHPRGMTISDLSRGVKMNRNLAAKYLDMLLISGQVEMQLIGAARVYFLSQRVPVSALLEFSSDLVIMIGSDQRIVQLNEQVPLFAEEKREAMIGKRIEEIASPFIRGLDLIIPEKITPEGKEDVTERSVMVKGELRYFRIKRVPTAFEDGGQGWTFIIEDVTAQKTYQQRLEISEARYRGMVRSVGEAIIGSSREGRIASWNPAAERLYGYTEQEVLDQPLHKLVPPDHIAGIDNLLGSVDRGDCVQRHGMEMLKKGGAPFDAAITICPIRGEDGSVAGASSIVWDITREKREQHVREQEEKYRTLVEDLNIGIYRSTGDTAGKFVWGNTALLDILGYGSLPDLREIHVADIFLKPDGRKELLEELRKSGFVKNRILHLARKDGTPITVSVTALAEFGKGNDPVFINGIVQDITGAENALASARPLRQ